MDQLVDLVDLLLYILAQCIKMKKKRIEDVKTWPEPKLVKDIQVFLGFANLYRSFIIIIALLTSIFQTTDVATKDGYSNIKADNNIWQQMKDVMLVVLELMIGTKIC